MPQILSSMTLMVVDKCIRMTSITCDNEPVPATEGAKRMGNTSSEEGPVISLRVGRQKTIWIRAREAAPPWPCDWAAIRQDIERSLKTSTYFSAACRRCEVWAMLQLMRSGLTKKVIFRRIMGSCKPLEPGPTPVILQRIHHSPVAITKNLASKPCTGMNEVQLLVELNKIFHTVYPMQDWLFLLLEHLLAYCPDIGYIYALLRPYWRHSLQLLPGALVSQKRSDTWMRGDAVNTGYIRDANIPPRRVWDLYSNRVIPYYYLPAAKTRSFPRGFMTVSHSWVAEEDRYSDYTPINGNQWPVPIPCGTTLEHIRIELLNLGAEYAWLDVLCLRQSGKEEYEAQRKDEWKLDIPTIGYIYSIPGVPCVTYFNGLGLPFDPSPKARSSLRHWLQRAWTMQESVYDWLPGGLTRSRSPADAVTFFHEHHAPAIVPHLNIGPSNGHNYWLRTIVHMLAIRHSTTDLDKVSSLPYILGCKSLPLYEIDCPPGLAWVVLLKHLTAEQRGAISLFHIEQHPYQNTILPTWQELTHGSKSSFQTLARGLYYDKCLWSSLELDELVRKGDAAPGRYYYRADHCAGPFLVTKATGNLHNTTLHVVRVYDGDHGLHTDRSYQLIGIVGGPFRVNDGTPYFFWSIRWNMAIIFHCLDMEEAEWKGRRCGVAHWDRGSCGEWDSIFRGKCAERIYVDDAWDGT